MKWGELMRFAQILYNKAHWIFEADEKPQFAQNIILVDITDKPEVKEGWDYDEVSGTFSEPVIPEPTPQEPTETELLQEYVVDVDFRLAMIELGF